MSSFWRGLADLAGVAAGGWYFLAFASPRWLRRAWQEPELRAFLGRAARLPRLFDATAIIAELESGAATSLGAPNARIGLWNAEARKLYFPLGEQTYALDPSEPIPAARAFRTQQPAFSANVPLEHPEYAEMSRKWRLTAVLAAPISAGAKRLGVLVVYAPRAPIFADDDLALLQLLADQAAVILESRTLIDARHSADQHVCAVESNGPVIGMYDASRIMQLLENLTENGVKYSPHGGKVRLKVWADSDCAYISVTDQGIGIPPDDLPHIFERFYRAANVDDRQFAGMGLGLFICRGIVAQHGGRIHVSSRPGAGSSFQIELPLTPVMEESHA